MKKLIKKLDWWFDCYIAWMYYNPRKEHKYIEYMRNKWPEKIKEYEKP